MTETFDDGGVDDVSRCFDGRMQELDCIDWRVGAREERRAGEAFGAGLCGRAARIAVASEVRVAMRLREKLRDDERQRERKVYERVLPVVQLPALGCGKRHSSAGFASGKHRLRVTARNSRLSPSAWRRSAA